MAAQEMGTITAPQTCNTRALDANMLGSRPRKKLKRKCNPVSLLGKEIPRKEAEIQTPLLKGCSASWLSRQLGTQQKKAAPRQTIRGTWRQDAIDKNKQESEPLSHSLALNYVEQILKICLSLWNYAKRSPLLQQFNYLGFLESLSTTCQLSVSYYQTSESNQDGWQSLAS